MKFHFTHPTTKPSDSDDLQDVKLGTGALGTADCKRTSELLSGSLQVSRVVFGLGKRRVFFWGGLGGGAEKKGGCVFGWWWFGRFFWFFFG